MSRHIRMPKDVNHINHEALDGKKIIHIKTVPCKNGLTHFYWNKSRSELIIGSKVHFPVPSIAHIERYHAKFSDLQRDEIQIGDSVVWIFGKQIQPVVCATVIGATRWKGKRFLRLLPNHVASKLNEMWVRFDKNNFFLVSNNKNIRHRAPPNIIYAAYQDELNKVEEIYGPIRSRRQVLKYLTGKNLSVGEVAFRECHEILFKGIYTWAGNYRDIEVIVTNRQFPTL
ncbi:hypothetical protein KP831_003653, partial [Escherichia coli]|nr:hypothetical protein [Escherichia coli]